MMPDQSDFTIEAYGTVTPPPDPPEDSEDADEVGDEAGDD